MITNRELIGKEVEARIISYSYKKGYGFARAIDGTDIFVSSYHVGGSKAEKALFFGSKISLKYGLFKDRICATEIKLLEQYPYSDILKIETTDGEMIAFPVEKILKIGVSELSKNVEFLQKAMKEENIPENYYELGYTDRDFKVLFIELKDGITYRFFEKGSKILGSGQLNVVKTYSDIYDKFLVC